MLEPSKSILILDDDFTFRHSVSEILQRKGYEILEASDACEAVIVLAKIEPLLAIVDFGIAGTDGLSWLTHLREEGRKFPVVFVSTDWCNPKTFDWLRNILKVSLILKKPIVPELFWLQIEAFMPLPKALSAEDRQQAALLEEERDKDISSQAMVLVDKLLATNEYSIDELEFLIEAAESQEALFAQLQEMEMKFSVEAKIRLASSNYAKQLVEMWQQLQKLVQSLQQDLNDRMLLAEAIQASHRIAGSAGTFGFHQIGQRAKKIEGLLQTLDPTDTLQEVIWNEVFRCLADGESFAMSAISKSAEQNEFAGPNSQLQIIHGHDQSRILVVDDDTVLSNFVATILAGENMIVDTLATPLVIMDKLLDFQPDLVILDVMMPGLSGYDVCRMIRASEFSNLPVLFLTSKSSPDSRAAAFQAGGSDFLPKPVMAPDLIAHVRAQLEKSARKIESAKDEITGA